MKKIAVITCYHDPDYVRARSLRAAVAAQPGVKTIVIKNRSKGLLRYGQVLRHTLLCKLRDKPDAFLLTFRGQEILPLVLLIAGRTPLWFDEFIVPSVYAKGEKHRRSVSIVFKHFLARAGTPLYTFCLNRCERILADTVSHANLSARLARVNRSKYVPVFVGTDEKLFKPAKTAPKKSSQFQVFYYTTGMQPLHGIPYVLKAAELLQNRPDITFLLVGGKLPMKQAVKQAVKHGAHITYHTWVDFGELPRIMRQSGLCLGGPFGGTPQAQHVITGKTYQSLACGAPTLVGKNTETLQLFTDRINSLVVAQKDAQALADAIRWAADNPAELARIGTKGRELYDKHFSAAALANQIAPLITSLR